jgi:hypothetical protein
MNTGLTFEQAIHCPSMALGLKPMMNKPKPEISKFLTTTMQLKKPNVYFKKNNYVFSRNGRIWRTSV